MLWPQSVTDRARPLGPELRQLVEVWAKDAGIAPPDERLVTDFYVPMASWIADHALEGMLVVGLCGAQGTGKSTLALLLRRLLEFQHFLRVAILSLDDLYLSREQREQRAEAYHPLLVTRGVPGTHDVQRGVEVVRRLRSGDAVALPRFDKATDQPLPTAARPMWNGPCDVLLFEGWCVGARPQRQRQLSEPVNGFERLEDSTGAWRWYVNRQLGGPYQELFAELDLLVLLRPPDFEHVFTWREQQEEALRGGGNAPGAMSPTAVRRFVRHFERISRFILEEMPDRAHAVIDLDSAHVPVEVRLGDE